MARQPLQRIDEQQVRPTIALDNTMVQASEGIDATGASAFDFTDGLMKALPQFFKAAGAFQEQENKDLAEIGERMNAELAADPTLSLDKLVAKYTKSDSTPGRLRKQLNRWVQGGKINASANRFWARSIEEGQAKRSRSRFGALLMSELPDIVQAQKAVAHLGETAMMEAGEQYVAKMIEDHPELYDQMGEYGVATVTASLIEEGNKLTAMGLSVATEELNNERVSEEISGLGSSLVDDFKTASAQNAPVDPADLVKGYGKSVGKSFSDLQDVALPDALRDNIVNDTRTRFSQIARMTTLTDDEAVEAIDALMIEIELARESTGNGPGTGPHVLPATGKHMAELHRQAAYAKGEISRRQNSKLADRFEGRKAIGAEIRQYDWAKKNIAQWSDDDREAYQDWEQNLLSSGVSAEYFDGAMEAVKANNQLYQRVKPGGELTAQDQAYLKSAGSPEALYDSRNIAPLLGDIESIIAWATQPYANGEKPHPDVVAARFEQFYALQAATRSSMRTQQAKMSNIIEAAISPEIPGALQDQDLSSAEVKVYSNSRLRQLAESPEVVKKFAEIDMNILEGAITPDAAIQQKMDYVRTVFNELPDNPASTEAVQNINAKFDATMAQIQTLAIDPAKALGVESLARNPLTVEKDRVGPMESPTFRTGSKSSNRAQRQQVYAAGVLSVGFDASPEELLEAMRASDKANVSFTDQLGRRTKPVLRESIKGLTVDSKEFKELIEEANEASALYLQGKIFSHVADKDMLSKDFNTLDNDFFLDLGRDFYNSTRTSTSGLTKEEITAKGREFFNHYQDKAPNSLFQVRDQTETSVSFSLGAVPLGALTAGKNVTLEDMRDMTGKPTLNQFEAETLWSAGRISPPKANYTVREPSSNTRRMTVDMDKRMESDPIMRYHWEAAKRLYELNFDQAYDKSIKDHRYLMVPIYEFVIDKSANRKFD